LGVSIGLSSVEPERNGDMKRLLLLVPFVTVFVWAQTTTSSRQPFSITISGPLTEVKTGTDVEIKIRLTNTSGHEINLPTFHSGAMNISYSYDVRDSSGTLVEKKNKGRSVGSATQRTVGPGETVEEETIINRVFDMSRPAQYEIQVYRTISGDPKDGVVKSNIITVKVAP
jgi:hypothetical protein